MSKHVHAGIPDAKIFQLMHNVLEYLREKSITPKRIHADIDAWKLSVMDGARTIMTMRRRQETMTWDAEVYAFEAFSFNERHGLGNDMLKSVFLSLCNMSQLVCESTHTIDDEGNIINGYMRTNDGVFTRVHH